MKEFVGIMEWSYDDLKMFKKDAIKHTIELVEGVNPFWKNKRPMNPKIEVIMQ